MSRYRRLRAKVAEHKSALKYHREALRETAAELDEVKAACRREGIEIVTVPGTGEIHSHAVRSS